MSLVGREPEDGAIELDDEDWEAFTGDGAGRGRVKDLCVVPRLSISGDMHPAGHRTLLSGWVVDDAALLHGHPEATPLARPLGGSEFLAIITG